MQFKSILKNKYLSKQYSILKPSENVFSIFMEILILSTFYEHFISILSIYETITY